MNIDWSKAPEGATHYAPAGKGVDERWFDMTTGDLGSVWYEDQWHVINFSGIRKDLIAKPAPWNGEGLPPVGAVCEFAGGTPCPEDPFDKDLKEGMKVTIIAHFKCGDFTLAAFTFDPENPDRGMVQVEQGNFGCFRPIRTPEQIAAEERKQQREQLADLIAGYMGFDDPREIDTNLAGYIVDHDYRKQVQP